MDKREKYLNMPLEEKRSLYSVKSKYYTLNDIDEWPIYCKKHELFSNKFQNEDIKYSLRTDIASKVSIWKGNITALEIDCIVNAAKKSLLGGGGVDGAIHDAAGDYLFNECKLLNGCNTGQAKITGGYKLPAKYIIHTVGPIGEKPRELKDCYLNSLKLAAENKCRTIAFPCVSTGVYDYPNLAAAKIALQTVREFLELDENFKHFDRIIFCLFLNIDVEIYEKHMNFYFPIENKKNEMETVESNNQDAVQLQNIDILNKTSDNLISKTPTESIANDDNDDDDPYSAMDPKNVVK